MHVDTLTDHSCSAESDGEKVGCASELSSDVDKCNVDSMDQSRDRREGLSPKPVTSSPLTGVEAPVLTHHHHQHHHLHHLHHLHSQREDLTRSLMNCNASKLSSCLDNRPNSSGAPQNLSAKPKLWSLAEIATSDQKQQHQQQGQPEQPSCPSSNSGLLTPPTPSATTPAASSPSLYPTPSILGRPIYYTSPFYSNYTNYGNFSPLQGQGILRYTNSAGVSLAAAAAAAAAANEGLSASLRASEAGAENKLKPDSPPFKNNSNQIAAVEQQHFRATNIEAKKGT